MAPSLTQPWASLMAFDEKRFETRGWDTRNRGDIAIVASKGFPPACRDLFNEEPFRSVLRSHDVLRVSAKPEKSDLPLGVVLCVVQLVDCIPTTPEGSPRRLARAPQAKPAEYESDFGDYSPGRFAYVTTNLRPLAEPVPIERIEGGTVKPGGALGFYSLSPACEAAVRAQLGAGGA